MLLGAAAVLAITGQETDAQLPPLNLTVEGSEAGGIGGTVSAAEGTAVVDARLTFFVADETGNPEFVGRTFTDLDGRYAFELPSADCYSVVVDTPAGAPVADVQSMLGAFCVDGAGSASAEVDLS